MLGMQCTLDIEASGFGRNGYPIEVGYVRDDGQAWCTLIRPEPDWTHWDPAAEQLHGISRQALERHGRAPGAVCKRLNDALAGRIVYCDGWAHDYPWLARLYDAADMLPSFKLESVQRLLDDGARVRLDQAVRVQRETLARHRASSDARALQQALAGVLPG